MKRIYSFMVAAVASFAAISCTQELVNTTPETPEVSTGETVVFTAYTDGADKKAVLNGKISTWESGDQITIHNGEKGFNFSTTDEGTEANFTYVGNDFTGEKFMAVYPAKVFEANVDAKSVKVNIPTYQGVKSGTYNKDAAVAYTENNTLTFMNACARLKFTIKGNDVKAIEFYGNTEEGDDPIAITGDAVVTLTDKSVNVECVETAYTTGEGENQKTENKFGTWVKCYSDENNWCFTEGETYYAAIAPANFPKGVSVNFVYDDGHGGDAVPVKVKTTSKNITIAANTIVDLGELYNDPNKVDPSAYGVVGSFQGWDVKNPGTMEYVADGWIVAKNVELYKNDEFKFAKDKSWDVSYGTSAVTVLENNVEAVVVTSGSQNMKVSKNGKYNLYLNPNALKVKVECVEEYTDLKVTITIDNKANWSPLSITLKDGNTVIAENAAVTDNKYQISGDYIGSTLTCTLSNGNKTSNVMNVAITKNGATITLEETIIKLKIQLNTDNSKKWWGDTMKIHVWDTNTSFDTSWPGNTMTSEGNYTWSIIVPSELVGKTIKYLVHNGNGWQSSDSTVTIKAEGNTVTGSSIGIN